jgi:hypothetical protein
MSIPSLPRLLQCQLLLRCIRYSRGDVQIGRSFQANDGNNYDCRLLYCVIVLSSFNLWSQHLTHEHQSMNEGELISLPLCSAEKSISCIALKEVLLVGVCKNIRHGSLPIA